MSFAVADSMDEVRLRLMEMERKKRRGNRESAIVMKRKDVGGGKANETERKILSRMEISYKKS